MYVLNSKNDILDEIKENMNNFDELFIAVSFITSDGFKSLFDMSSMSSKVKIITTTEEYITDPILLKQLKKQGCQIKIISTDLKKRSFHSKFIISRKGNQYHSMLGSLNITKYALFNKYESVIVDHEPKKLVEHFNYLWQVGITLEDEYLNEYLDKYKKFKSGMEPFVKELNLKINIKPNEMQLKVLDELSDSRSKGKNKALLYAATGTGKTYLAAFDLKRKDFNKALFIVHSRLIIKSAMRDFSIVFSDKNMVELKTSNKGLVNGSDIIFTTQKTINRIKKSEPNFLSKFDHVIFDEAHKIGPNNEQGRILEEIININNAYILAMSATPWRSDNPDYVIDKFDRNIVGNIDLATAIDEGFVCDFKYSGIDVNVDFNIKDLNYKDLKVMVNKFIEELKNKVVWDNSKIKGIIFTKNIKEADLVTAEINNNHQYKAVSVHSKMTGELDLVQSEEIAEYINRLQNEDNELNFIVTVDMFNEGVDIPRINTIGMFRFTNSSIIFSQQIGRGLRKEGSDKKYLNIIDLVGNHESSFERIIGLLGKITANPRRVIEKAENNLSENFFLTDISRQKILKSISSNAKYKKFFEETLRYLWNYKSIIPELWELEKYLEEPMQIIANNFRKSRHFTSNSKSWVEEFYSVVTNDFVDISNIESGLIEIFSWLPLTVSTQSEKMKIYKLMNGERIKFAEKWYTYFCGKNNQWRFIYGDYSQYFDLNDDGIKFESKNISTKAKVLLKKVSDYLKINLDKNDKLQKTWYTKFEISFMAGIAVRNRKPYAKVVGDENKVFLINSLDKGYANNVISKNEYTISTSGKKEYDSNLTYYNFMGKKTLHANEMYLYVGEQLEPIEFKGFEKKEDNSEYATFIFKSKEEISDIDFKFLNLK